LIPSSILTFLVSVWHHFFLLKTCFFFTKRRFQLFSFVWVQEKHLCETQFWCKNASREEAEIPSFYYKAKSSLDFNFWSLIHFTKLPITFFSTSPRSCTPTTMLVAFLPLKLTTTYLNFPLQLINK